MPWLKVVSLGSLAYVSHYLRQKNLNLFLPHFFDSKLVQLFVNFAPLLEKGLPLTTEYFEIEVPVNA